MTDHITSVRMNNLVDGKNCMADIWSYTIHGKLIKYYD